ncbi:MAG: ribosomal protein S18-alanine N-acetyltransferase [Labilithrix sp.]|nr:ribosomal protein S18-alanine N-acetyltransferase [Labilithrix sp.]
MPSASLRIDDMSAGDVSAAIAIDIEAFQPSEIGAGREDPRVLRDQQLREEIARPWARVRVARRGDAVVGYALVWHVVDEVHLLNVAVAASERRRGVARALMDDLLAYARDKGVARILLEVRASNAPAISLYEAFGFTRFSVRERYYADGEDAIEMSLGVAG